MNDFLNHTIDSAPARAKPVLQAAKKAYGMIPNLYGKMAESPSMVEGYWQLSQIFSRSSLSPIENQLVLIAASVVNRCDYCVGAHSTLAVGAGMPTEVLEALRTGKPIAEPRLQALRTFTQGVVENRGWMSPTEIDDFLKAGFNRAQILEVILGVGMKTLSNYTNHLVQTELDPAFQNQQWKPVGKQPLSKSS